MAASSRIHRPTAYTAAVLMILFALWNLSVRMSFFGKYDIFSELTQLLRDILITVLLIVVLFRRKKDVAAGVIFLVMAIVAMFEVGFELLSVLAGFEMIGYALLNALIAMLVVGFRATAAIECISGGKVSASGARVLLWLLPVLACVCTFGVQMILHTQYGSYEGGSVFGSAVYVIPNWLGTVLMGIALSLPERAEE